MTPLPPVLLRGAGRELGRVARHEAPDVGMLISLETPTDPGGATTWRVIEVEHWYGTTNAAAAVPNRVPAAVVVDLRREPVVLTAPSVPASRMELYADGRLVGVTLPSCAPGLGRPLSIEHAQESADVRRSDTRTRWRVNDVIVWYSLAGVHDDATADAVPVFQLAGGRCCLTPIAID